MHSTIEPVVTKLSLCSTISVTRYPTPFTMALNAEDLRWAADLLKVAADLNDAKQGSPVATADIRRIALEFVAAANVADAEKEADREEAARHDAEVDAAQEAAERNAPAHE